MLNVMVVEDERIIRQGVVNLVNRYGKGLVVCSECENAYEAWNTFRVEPPDLVITDIIMKGMSGLDLIKHIRESGSDTPIVVLSGFSEFSYAQTAMRYDVKDYLLKPVDILEFSRVLERICWGLEPEATIAHEDVESAAIRQAVKWIDEHLGEELSQEALAEQVELTGSYLSALFKSQMGINYSEYIQQRRIYEIARLCGYHSDKHFINIFRRFVGSTPSKYRNQNRG